MLNITTVQRDVYMLLTKGNQTKTNRLQFPHQRGFDLVMGVKDRTN